MFYSLDQTSVHFKPTPKFLFQHMYCQNVDHFQCWFQASTQPMRDVVTKNDTVSHWLGANLESALTSFGNWFVKHYNDVIMGAMASQITNVAIVYSTVYSGADQRKHEKLRVTGLCVGNSPVTDEFPAQMASSTENVFIWWRHHECVKDCWYARWLQWWSDWQWQWGRICLIMLNHFEWT